MNLQRKWQELRYGVEIEFIEGRPQDLELLPGWMLSPEEKQIDESGQESGSELKPPPLRWEEREGIRTMLERLKGQGAKVNWSCGLHVHVEAAPYGSDVLDRLLEAALTSQEALSSLLGMSPHRRLYCPSLTEAMAKEFRRSPGKAALRNAGRPQSHRCGINIASWFELGTVEIRYANASLCYAEVIAVVELCLRFVAAAAEGRTLPDEPAALAAALGVPAGGYPPSTEPPRWFLERMWLEQTLFPVFEPMLSLLLPEGELHHLLPVPEGILTAVELPGGELRKFIWRPAPAGGWERLEDGPER